MLNNSNWKVIHLNNYKSPSMCCKLNIVYTNMSFLQFNLSFQENVKQGIKYKFKNLQMGIKCDYPMTKTYLTISNRYIFFTWLQFIMYKMIHKASIPQFSPSRVSLFKLWFFEFLSVLRNYVFKYLGFYTIYLRSFQWRYQHLISNENPSVFL